MILKKLKFKNVLSYGNNFTEIEFKNGIDIVYGPNGKGKTSAFLDTLTFAFFGKPYRKIKQGSFINNKNKKELLVEVEFETNKEYKIIRGLKPNIFEIYYKEGNNWKLIPQDSHVKLYQEKLEEILGFNEILFRQIIVLGANINMKNFVDLSQKEKEEIFQNLTNTYIFNLIVQIAKEKRKELITEISNLEYKISELESNIKNLELEYEKIKKQNEEIAKNKDEKIKEINEQINVLQKKCNQIKDKLKEKETLSSEYEKLQNSYDNLKEKYDKIIMIENSLNSKIDVYHNSEIIECPKCNHKFKNINIDINDLQNKLKTIKEKKEKLHIVLEDLDVKLSVITEKLDKFKLLENKLYEIEIKLNELENQKKIYENTKLIEIDYEYLDKKKKDFKKFKKQLNEKNEIKEKYDFIIQLITKGNLKDIILQEQLPLLNKFINEYLEKFNADFNFIIEGNLKEKIIRKGEDFEFNQLSNGQKQRIVLSLLFAFLKLMDTNGYKINILVLDEFLDSSLDEEGIQIIIDILKNEFTKHKNIVIITHNSTILSKIESDRIFEIKEEFGFSKLIERS